MQYRANQIITDGNYDKSLAVRCINGTFVGKKTDGVIAWRGIPFVGKQPVGENRWKARRHFPCSTATISSGRTPMSSSLPWPTGSASSVISTCPI